MAVYYKDMDEDKAVFSINIMLGYESCYHPEGLFRHIEYKKLPNGRYLKKEFITDGVIYDPNDVETKEISWLDLPLSAKIAFWKYNRKKIKKHNL